MAKRFVSKAKGVLVRLGLGFGLAIKLNYGGLVLNRSPG